MEAFGDQNEVVTFSNWDRSEDLLQPVMRAGKIVTQLPSLTNIQQHANAQKQVWADHSNYPQGLDPKLAEQKRNMIAACT